MREIFRPNDFCTVTKLLMATRGSLRNAAALADSDASVPDRVRGALKSAVAAGVMSVPEWAGALGGSYAGLVESFAESLRPRSTFFRLLSDGWFVPAPLRTRLTSITAAAGASVVGEGKPTPVSRISLANSVLEPLHVIALIVLSAEVVASQSPASQAFVAGELRGAVADAADAALFNIAIPSGSPAPTFSATGTTAADAIRDLRSALGLVSTTGAGRLFWVASPDVANALSALPAGDGTTDLGLLAFPQMGPTGGELLNQPCAVSGKLDAGSLLLLDASGFAAASESIILDASLAGTIELETAPMADGSQGTGSELVSLFQTHSVALAAKCFIGCEKIRSTAAVMITDVAYGS